MCKQMCLWLPFFWKTPTLYHVFVTLCSLILSLIIIVDSFLLNVLNVFGKWKEQMFFCCQWHVQNQPLWFCFYALTQNKANMKSQEGNGTLALTKWHECFKVIARSQVLLASTVWLEALGNRIAVSNHSNYQNVLDKAILDSLCHCRPIIT